VVVIDSESELVVVDHRFSGSISNAAANADRDSIGAALASMTVSEFCDAYKIPRRTQP
jgi:hypothetical protein